jgi:glyoxylase I family protein
MFKGIEHTAIATVDPEKLGAWYEKVLDFPIVYRYSGNVFVRAADGTMLELIPSEGDRPEAAMKSPGIRHLAVSVDDFDAGVKELESRGVTIFQTIEGGANRLAFFHDPEGNILHLIWREKAF